MEIGYVGGVPRYKLLRRLRHLLVSVVYGETVEAVAANRFGRGHLWTFDVTAIFAHTEAFAQVI
jgi:hypothetical protein